MSGLRCPFCRKVDNRVSDSRPTDTRIRRRRACNNCGARFTTFEDYQADPRRVVERGRSRWNRIVRCSVGVGAVR